MRGIYLARHFQNYYQVAPLEEVTRYVEDLSLWGVNNFLVWFGKEEFNGINDPTAHAAYAWPMLRPVSIPALTEKK